MSTALTNRAQSAYHRTSRRSPANAGAHLQQRPVTSMGPKQSYPTRLDRASVQTLESSTLSSATYQRYHRPKTASSILSTSSVSRPSRKLRSDEIESLLRSLERDDTFVVQVDCLANYRTLVQTIDLRKTPLDCQLLYALQRRENRIVQRNACRDVRFHSLLDVLQPSHVMQVEQTNSTPMETEGSLVSACQSSDLLY